MPPWVQDYGLFALIAAVVVVALIIWRLVARRSSEPVARVDQAPATPLQPLRPEIVAAEPAKFAAAPVPVAETVVAPPPAPSAIATPTGAPDNLSLLKGVGPKVKAILTSLGVTRFDQMAAWDAADIAAIDAHMGAFAGRITRDNWVDQASYLARGDKAGFEAKYGALGGEL